MAHRGVPPHGGDRALMRVGFVHGVMNTDNMSVLGLTIDYGPYGWLEDATSTGHPIPLTQVASDIVTVTSRRSHYGIWCNWPTRCIR